MDTLTVIVITRNEAANIRACLESVAWADEIVVVDAASMDATVEICREFTANIFVHDWPGFGRQKNRALGYANKDWVLSLDADERVTPELRAEIQSVLQGGQAAGYEIPRLSSFCGRSIRHSGWYPDYVLRLFKRGQGAFTDALVHEAVKVEGVTGRLTSHLLHNSYRDFEEVIYKLNTYSTAAAAMMRDRGQQGGLSRAVLHGLWSFVRTYFLRAGILDGREGFMLAVLNAEHSYYRYLKLGLPDKR